MMIPIKDLLNKIKWDKKENPKDYEIVYMDRVLQQGVKIKFKKISKIEEGFMTRHRKNTLRLLVLR